MYWKVQCEIHTKEFHPLYFKLVCIVCSWFESRAPSQYPKRRLSVRSRKVSKPRDWYFKLAYRFKIWQAHRQHCCRSACQISERSDNSKYKSRGFDTLRDLTERRLFAYWDGALVMSGVNRKWPYYASLICCQSWGNLGRNTEASWLVSLTGWFKDYLDGLAQVYDKSTAFSMELLYSCSQPSMYGLKF